MTRIAEFTPEFVESVPSPPKEGVLYVSIEYGTAIHLCACGCGEKVVTPFSRTDWKMTFDGESVSLNPSIGNWGFKCRSHYWIRENKVEWALAWTKEEIDAGRRADQWAKERQYGAPAPEIKSATQPICAREGFGARVKVWWSDLWNGDRK